MTHKLRVPTEMYAYIEFEYEGTADGAIDEYRRLTALAKGAQGLSDADFRDLYDKVSKGEKIYGDPTEILENLSVNQRFALNEVKKFKARNK